MPTPNICSESLRGTGELVDQLSMGDVMPEGFYQEYDGPSAEEGDWFHQNSIWFLDDEGDLLTSSRQYVSDANYLVIQEIG